MRKFLWHLWRGFCTMLVLTVFFGLVTFVVTAITEGKMSLELVWGTVKAMGVMAGVAAFLAIVIEVMRTAHAIPKAEHMTGNMYLYKATPTTNPFYQPIPQEQQNQVSFFDDEPPAPPKKEPSQKGLGRHIRRGVITLLVLLAFSVLIFFGYNWIALKPWRPEQLWFAFWLAIASIVLAAAIEIGRTIYEKSWSVGTSSADGEKKD